MHHTNHAPYKIAQPNVSVLNVLNWLCHDTNTQANMPYNTPTRHQATAVVQNWLDQDSSWGQSELSAVHSALASPCRLPITSDVVPYVFLEPEVVEASVLW